MREDGQPHAKTSNLPPAAARDYDGATRRMDGIQPDEGDGTPSPWPYRLPCGRVHLKRSNPGGAASGQNGHLVAHGHRPAPDRPGHDGPSARNAEGAIHRQPQKVPSFRAPESGRTLRQRGSQLLQPLAGHRRDGQHRPLRVPEDSLQLLANGVAAKLQPALVHSVPLGERDHAIGNAQNPGDRQMLSRLRHRALVRRHDQEQQIDTRGPGQHVLHEVFVAGHVDDADLQSIAERQGGEAEVDRKSPLPLLLPPVRLDSRERPHQSGLSMVDVAGGTDDERPQRMPRARKSRDRMRTPSARW